MFTYNEYIDILTEPSGGSGPGQPVTRVGMADIPKLGSLSSDNSEVGFPFIGHLLSIESEENKNLRLLVHQFLRVDEMAEWSKLLIFRRKEMC